MEARFDVCTAAAKALKEALCRYDALQGDFKLLYDYYFGGEWTADYNADCAGLLPADLKRGVLSQDGVYDLFEQTRRLDARLAVLEEKEV